MTQQDLVVLYVDDDDDDRLMVANAFEQLGLPHFFSCICGGGDLINHLITAYQGDSPSVRRPDLILLDLNMPIMTGFDVLAALKQDQRWAVIPTIVLTTSTDKLDVQKAYELGANSYVPLLA
jgi:CheY-like chemotaxis protein